MLRETGNNMTSNTTAERITLREVMNKQGAMIRAPEMVLVAEMERVIGFRPHFDKLIAYCRTNKIPIGVVNAGIDFVINDLYGFQISCKVPTAEISAFKKKWEQYESILRVVTVYRADKDGLETQLIRGRWLRKGDVNSRDRAAKGLRSLRACQKYRLRSSGVVGKNLRVAIGAEQSEIRQLLARFDKQKVRYRIAKPADLSAKAD